MATRRQLIILVGGSCPLGKEVAKAALGSGASVVSVDRRPWDTEGKPQSGVHEIVGDLLEPSVVSEAFGSCEDAESISVFYIASGRKEINNPLGHREASRLQVEALKTWATMYLDAAGANAAAGAFILISSVNSVLQSHSDPIYGALKAAAESLMKSFATLANSRGSGSFLSLRLGYVESPRVCQQDDRAPSRRAARMVIGERDLASWSDVSQTLMALVNMDKQILNGSTLWGDYGAHLMEQTHAVAQAISLGDR